MLYYEIVSREEWADILDGQAALDSGGDPGSSDESSESDDEDEEKEDKPRGGRRSRRAESEGDEEGDESSEESSASEPGEWYSTGYSEGESLSDREAAGGDDKAWRFYLNAGQETEVIVLDSGEEDKKKWERKASAPFNVWEHNFAVVNPDDPEDLTFYDLTCVRGKLDRAGKPRKCYVCERKKKIRRRFRSMYSVLSKYQGKRGEAWSKKLLPADKACLKKLKRHSKKHGLFGMKFNVFRSDDRSSRIGDDWSYDSTLSEQEVQELLGDRQDLSPIDYVEECRPQSWDELENLLKDAIISDPKKKGKGKRGRRSDDDDKPRGRGRDRDDDDRSSRRSSRDDDEDKPRRRPRDDDDEASDEKSARRPRRDDAEDKPRRRNRDEEKDEDESDDEGSSDDTEETEEKEQTQEAPASGASDDDIPF